MFRNGHDQAGRLRRRPVSRLILWPPMERPWPARLPGAFVQLVVAHGHLNNVLADLAEVKPWEPSNQAFIDEATAGVEERIQGQVWGQTLIYNVYSLPPFYPDV
jgi:hypothetical protein